jgi:UDP-N-acetylmuramate dehydrogenase
VGGPARYFLEAQSERSVVDALAWARSRGAPVVVLGGGSNLLVADRGLDALVLRVAIRGVTCAAPGTSPDDVIVEAGAGESWEALVARAVESGWAGIECLSGIPGDVGAAPIQNIGAYGQEVAETILRVRAVDRQSGEIIELDGASCGFGYRDSIFKREAKDRYAITSVTFKLRQGGAPTVRYAELARKLESASSNPAGAAPPPSPSLAAVRAAVLELRRSKSMLLDPSDENGRSAGSFFMNPTLDAAAFEGVKARVDAAGVVGPGESMPAFPAAGGRVKLSAAWLIERAGLRKGTADGRVGLSTRHTLAIVNRGGATAAEILAFAQRVRATVLDRFGVALVPEPVLLGFTPDELGPFADAAGL